MVFNFIHNNRAEYCGCEPIYHSKHRCFFLFLQCYLRTFQYAFLKSRRSTYSPKGQCLSLRTGLKKGVTSHPNNITPSKQYICMLNDLNAIRIMLYSFIFLIVIPYHQSNLPGFKLSAISFFKNEGI